MAIASLILGIICLLVSFSIFKDMSLICGVIGIVLGIIAIVKKKGKVLAIIAIVLSIIGLIVLFSDGGKDNSGKITKVDSAADNNIASESSTDNTESSLDQSGDEEQVMSVGDTWTVDKQWKLTINSVKSTDERNQYSEKQPEQVVIVTYSYENLGYKSDFSDGLFFGLDPGLDVTVVDEKGEVAESYPGDVAKYPQETPEGAKCSEAQSIIGLANKSEYITMTINKYDGDGNSQSVKCKLKVD